MGLGISKTSSLCFLIRKLLEDKTSLILDASSLIPDVLNEIINTKTVVTPHAGEFKRMFGQDPGQTKSEQISIVEKKLKSMEL